MCRSSLPILFCVITTLLCSALEFDLQPWNTDRPVPESIMFFDAERASSDPQFVDVILANTRRGNATTLFERHDLGKNPEAGFRIPAGMPAGPGYVVRMADTSKTPEAVLAESQQFEIYPAGTPPSVSQSSTLNSATILEAQSVAASSSPLPTSIPVSEASDTPVANAETSKLPVGAIAGGVVGGVFLIVLFVVLLYCIRKQGRPLTPEELEKKRKSKEKDMISPFMMTPQAPSSISHDRHSETMDARPPAATGHKFSSRNEKMRLANNMQNFFTPSSVERLPTEISANSTNGGSCSSQHHRGTSTSTHGTSSSLLDRHRRKRNKEAHDTSNIERTDELRRERARLDEEISDLERRASMGGSRGPRRVGTDSDEMLAQLTALREQMRMVEAQQSGHVIPDEPPPDYYPASLHPRS